MGARRRTSAGLTAAVLLLTATVSTAATAVGAGATPARGDTAVTAPPPPEVEVTELDLAGVDSASLEDLPDVAPAPAEEAGLGATAEDGLAGLARAATEDAPEPAPDVLTPEMDVAPFSVMGVTWDATDADVVIRYRVRQDGVWSDWEAVGSSDIGPDAGAKDRLGRRGATDAIVAVGADGVQIWAEADAGAVTGLKAVLIDPGEDPAGISAGLGTTVPAPIGDPSRVPAAPVAAAGLAAAPAPAPTIIRRSQWGADESMRTCEPDLATATLAAAVHHTASTNSYSAADVPGLLRGFLAYHTRPEAAGGRGWCDIGYNFLVDKYGRIFEGRAGSIEQAVVGVHTGGFNSRTLGVSAIGEYGAAAPTGDMLEAISQVIAWKFQTHRVSANSVVTLVSGGGASKYPEGTAVTFNTIYGHRDAQLTSCPGQNLYNALQAIRNRVAAIANAAVAASPTGNVEVWRASRTEVTVSGWALDPDTTGPIDVTVTVDGSPTRVTAGNDRPDLAAYFPGAGTRHGFSVQVPAGSGSRAVCVWAHNVGAGNDLLMGCRRMNLSNKVPIGTIDAVTTTSSSLTVTGWALDPDTPEPIAVHVYVDGRAVRGIAADLPRPDVAAAYGNGERHGYTTTLPATPGPHTVCVYAIDSDGGSTNPQIGCRAVTIANTAPIGALESVVGGTDSVTVSGWALDPDTDDPIQTHVYVDGRAVRGLTADVVRTDIGARYGKGDAHGFSTTIPTAPGTHTVCAYAIDSSLVGPNPQLGCRTAVVGTSNRAPLGALEKVTTTSAGITVEGWALDPDTNSPIQVHVYVDGRAVLGASAAVPRSDIGLAHGRGDDHGYALSVPLAPGGHTVCVYAIDAGLLGPNPQLGCRSVVVTNRAPFGALDVATGQVGAISVAGWALDPDTTAPIQVHVYVDGQPLAGVVARTLRTDVGAVFGMGDNHGYVWTGPATPGPHTVCVYAIDTSLRGPNPQLACRVVTVR